MVFVRGAGVPGCAGTLVFNGLSLLSSPPKHGHQCNVCMVPVNLPEISGTIQYETDEDHA